MSETKRTPLYDLHRELGGRMVPFAGWELPVQYTAGIIAEHRQARERAALFDVSHMAQLRITGPDPARALEALVPAELVTLPGGRARYTVLTNDQGGVIDDLIVTQADDHLFMVVNASRAEVDLAHLRTGLDPAHHVEHLADRALLALQGPQAASCLARLCPDVGRLRFMESAILTLDAHPARVSRLGYTGEDGFEVSVPAARAEPLARALLAMPEVRPAGLGARDSLRMEAGLCLYGHELDATTSPVEAGLGWTIGKRRRAEGGFPGDHRIRHELAHGPERRLVGIRPQGRAPAREGCEIRSGDGTPIGAVTSGGFGPTVGGPIAIGYVKASAAAPGTPVRLIVRGQELAAEVTPLPFIPHRYAR